MLVLFLSAVAGCSQPESPLAPLSGRYRGHDVLLITIDSLRADHLGCYGYATPTPTIDALAERSIVFDALFTTSSTTLPAHVSLLTGRNPGDLRNGYTLSDSAVTLAEATHTLTKVDQLLGDDYTLFYQIAEMLEDLSGAARAVRVLAAYLERHPEALVSGRGD